MRIGTYIAVSAAVCLAIAGMEGKASAAKTRVDIKSKPSGATVWIDDRTSDPVGTTPLTVKLEPGKHTLFVELEGYEAASQDVRVTRKQQRVSITLTERKTGTILVLPAEGNAEADEAKVLVDGKEVGSVPDSFDVDEGEHEVEVVRDGYQPFKKTVEVKTGDSVEVLVTLVKGSVKPDVPPDNPDKPPDGSPPTLTATALPRISPFSIGASLGVATRDYNYVDLAADGTLRPFDAPGLGIAEIAAELRLGGLASARWLRPFSIFGAFSINLPTKSSTKDDMGGQSGNEDFPTTWIRHDAGLRTKFSFGSFWLAVDLAEGGDSLDISSNDPAIDNDDLPNLSYLYLRLGASVGYNIGDKNSLAVGGDGLLPLSVSGVVDKAFADDDVYGFRFHGWYRRYIAWNIEAMLTARFLQFFHSFTNIEGMQVAEGADDRVIEALLNVAYRF